MSFSFSSIKLAIKLTLLMCFVIGNIGCTHTKLRKFEDVRVGMSKSMVVETAGNPTKTRRWQGKDRWIYEFHDRDDSMQTREVHFEAGRATYVGAKVKTQLSAEEQDKLNEAALADDERKYEERELERDKRLNISRPGKGAQSVKIDPRFREHYYGQETDPAIERRKAAPVFAPVD